MKDERSKQDMQCDCCGAMVPWYDAALMFAFESDDGPSKFLCDSCLTTFTDDTGIEVISDVIGEVDFARLERWIKENK